MELHFFMVCFWWFILFLWSGHVSLFLHVSYDFFVMICTISPAFMDWVHTREDLHQFPWLELLEALKPCPGNQECVFFGFCLYFLSFVSLSSLSPDRCLLLRSLSFLALSSVCPWHCRCSDATGLSYIQSMLVSCLHSKYRETEINPLGSSHKNRNIGLTFHSSLSLPREKLLVGILFPFLLRS